METLLNIDLCQMQQELTGSLGMPQQAIALCLKAMGIVQKRENWTAYKLKPRETQTDFSLVNMNTLLQRQSPSPSNHNWWKVDSLWQSTRNHGVRLTIYRQHSTAKWVKTRSVFSGISWVELWAAKTERNLHEGLLPITINAFEPSIDGEMVGIWAETR